MADQSSKRYNRETRQMSILISLFLFDDHCQTSLIVSILILSVCTLRYSLQFNVTIDIIPHILVQTSWSLLPWKLSLLTFWVFLVECISFPQHVATAKKIIFHELIKNISGMYFFNCTLFAICLFVFALCFQLKKISLL